MDHLKMLYTMTGMCLTFTLKQLAESQPVVFYFGKTPGPSFLP